jgi:hypothetical protein
LFHGSYSCATWAADPAAVLANLKEKSRKERAPGLSYAIYACVRRARDLEGEPSTHESPDPLAFRMRCLVGSCVW